MKKLTTIFIVAVLAVIVIAAINFIGTFLHVILNR